MEWTNMKKYLLKMNYNDIFLCNNLRVVVPSMAIPLSKVIEMHYLFCEFWYFFKSTETAPRWPTSLFISKGGSLKQC